MSITDMTAGRMGQAPVGRPFAWLACRPRAAKPPADKVSPRRRSTIRVILQSEVSKTLGRLVIYLGALTSLAFLAIHFSRSLPPVPVPEPVEAPEWVRVGRPFAAFSLAMPELPSESARDYGLRRHVSGGRQDILSWGTLDGETPHLMVEIYRPGTEITGFDSPEREIAMRLEAAEATVVRLAGSLETKFGDMALVAFPIGDARQCLGFVRSHDEPRLQILGWHCVSGAAAPEPDFVACALDRLSLVAAGSEPKVREVFARAELKRNFCGQRSHLYVPTPKLGPNAPAPQPKAGRVASR